MSRLKSMKILFTGFLALPLAVSHSLCLEDSARPTVTVSYGEIYGTATVYSKDPSATVYKYLGIPFAQSPPERFSPPAPVSPWNVPLNATEFKPACIQQFIEPSFEKIFNSPPPPESEDCLHLNIFVPAGPPPQGGHTVMFWIHGGSFQLGSGRLRDYDGSRLAANQNTIVVTINYRTNVFGFPTSPEIPFQGRNLGFLDQRQALSWVHQNIAAFGGDPSKVTLFGESAGGYSVKQLLMNPPRPLQFRAAIIQSQAFGPEQDGETSWMKLAIALGCNTEDRGASILECVRSASAENIRSIINRQPLGFTPTFDNITNRRSFEDSVKMNTFADVPVLIGTNAHEGTVLAPVMPATDLLLSQIFAGDSHSQAVARGTYHANVTGEALIARIVTDFLYTCTTSAIAKKLAVDKGPVWRYYFNASFPNSQPFEGAGVWHTSEIPLVFGTYVRDNQTTAQQRRLSRFIQRSWADFAKDPHGGPGWEGVGDALKDLQTLGSDGTAWGETKESDAVDHICSIYAPAFEKSGI